jgi:hypothetical protein
MKILLAFLLVAFSPFTAPAQAKPDKDYLVYVLSEGADKIALIRFGAAGIKIDHQIDTGDMPIDIDGPHGIVLSPDRQFYYVTIAHGRPFGSVWKYSTKNDALIGKASLGLFPGNTRRQSRRRFSLRRQLQPARRHDAVECFRGVDTDDD